MNTLSIIIPTLNEARNLEKTVLALFTNRTSNYAIQIIVVDGGSKDGTQEIAQRLPVGLIHRPDVPKGRAFLLNQGAVAATGEYLLFLDADSIVPKGYDTDIQKTLEQDGVVGGAFEFTLDGDEFGLRVVEFINRTRYRIWKRYYGDQGIFVRKSVFKKVGGYPKIALMEASEFCVALAKEGALCLIKKPMLTSARRFLDHGIYRVLGFDIKMWWLNLLGYDVQRYAQSYWEGNDV